MTDRLTLSKATLNLEDQHFCTTVAQRIKYRCAKTDRMALCKTKGKATLRRHNVCEAVSVQGVCSFYNCYPGTLS